MPVSWVYGWVAARRRRSQAAGCARLPVPVISVGNITCGGTGKTPVVEMLARGLLERGRRPAILSRGYGAAPPRPDGRQGENDEALVLAANLPGVPHRTGADRAASGRAAIASGADVLLLDDGFQHVRLHRDLDLVLIDALDPFGGGRVLPAGLLRERLETLGEADLIAITRGGLAPPGALRVLRWVLRERFPRIPLLEIETDPVAWEGWGADGSRAVLAPEALRGKRAAVFAGIGNPEAFRLQVEALGVSVSAWLPFPDHHRYRPEDIEDVRRAAERAGAEAVLTTQKDAVKLSRPPAGGPPWLFLRIASRPARGEEALREALDRVLSGGRVPSPAAAGQEVR